MRNIVHASIFMVLLGASGAQAQDSWRGSDKVLHLAGSAGMGLVASNLSPNGWEAFGGCAAVGVAKELADSSGLGRASAKDLVADLVGCGLGVAGGRLLIRVTSGQAQVTYSLTLR